MPVPLGRRRFLLGSALALGAPALTCTAMVRDAARRSPLTHEQIVDRLRGFVGSRRTVPFVSEQEPLLDVLVHTQDICLPLDLDRHGLGGGFGRCSRHWDVGYGAIADPSAPVAVSDESDDVAWFPVDALPERIPPGFAERLAGAVRAARAVARP